MASTLLRSVGVYYLHLMSKSTVSNSTMVEFVRIEFDYKYRIEVDTIGLDVIEFSSIKFE